MRLDSEMPQPSPSLLHPDPRPPVRRKSWGHALMSRTSQGHVYPSISVPNSSSAVGGEAAGIIGLLPTFLFPSQLVSRKGGACGRPVLPGLQPAAEGQGSQLNMKAFLSGKEYFTARKSPTPEAFLLGWTGSISRLDSDSYSACTPPAPPFTEPRTYHLEYFQFMFPGGSEFPCTQTEPGNNEHLTPRFLIRAGPALL